MPDDTIGDKASAAFALFNEIGILAQLSRALLERRLPAGLLAPHFTVLNHLVRLGDGRTPLEMARAFQVPKTSMTHTLSGLEQRGLIRLGPNPNDGRSKLVYLTVEGRALREATIAATGADLARIDALFPVDRMAALVPDLAELRQVLDSNRPED